MGCLPGVMSHLPFRFWNFPAIYLSIDFVAILVLNYLIASLYAVSCIASMTDTSSSVFFRTS